MNRRRILKYAAGGAALLAGAGGAAFVWMDRKFNPKTPLDYEFPDVAQTAVGNLVATPSCVEPGEETLVQTEGPFYTPNTPLRSMVREGQTVGQPLIVEGIVTDTQCRPIANAVIDIWSCDGDGVYDNDGYGLRGHQFTDANGAFRFSTVKPAAYKAGRIWRTPHIHVKVQGKATSLLTTQLYFPDEPLNTDDSIFNDALLVAMKTDSLGGDDLVARFDFVLT